MEKISFGEYLRENVGIDEQLISKFSEKLTLGSVSKNEILFKPNQLCNHAFFVEKGLLRLYTIDEKGKEHMLQFAPEGWFIGDRGSMYFKEVSYYYIDAIEDTSIVYISDEFLDFASQESPKFRKYNERLLHNHIRHLQKRINNLIAHSAEEKYQDFIKLYPDLTLRVPQWMIASFLGIAPESLSRVRRNLAKENYNPGSSIS